METNTPRKQSFKPKNKLVHAHSSGLVSLILLGLMTLLVIFIIVGRVKNASLMKELSIVPFNLNPNLQQDYQSLSTFFTIDTVLIIFTWIMVIVYFVAWFLRFKNIRLDALIIYTLLGFVLASGVYLSNTQPLVGQVTKLTQAQTCLIEDQETPAYCENDQPKIEPLLQDMGQQINDTYFIIQTSFLAMVFFLVLSILQLLMDRVKKLIIFRKKYPIGAAHGQAII